MTNGSNNSHCMLIWDTVDPACVPAICKSCNLGYITSLLLTYISFTGAAWVCSCKCESQHYTLFGSSDINFELIGTALAKDLVQFVITFKHLM